MKVKVIYKDNDILILDKPSGVTVNKADTTKNEITLQEYIDSNFSIESLDKSSDFYKRSGIVHRLDKETSGILIVAKNIESFNNLQSQFKNRNIEKTYIALVHGKINEREGEIVAPVGRLPWNRKRFGVLAGGKEASTRYKILESFSKPFTLLEIYPKTGRTHQIRVHMKYFNHPVFSDIFYAGRKTAKEDRRVLDRIFLHAAKISFHHPKTNEKLSFSSELPEELEKTVNLLRS